MGRLRWSLVILLGSGLGGCALAGADRAPRSNGMGRQSVVDIESLGLEQVEGRIKSVDPRTGIVIVELVGQADEVDLVIDPKTMIYVAGGVGALKDLEEGAPIRASFESDGPGNLAHWIEVPRDENPPPPAEEPPPPVQAAPSPGASQDPGAGGSQGPEQSPGVTAPPGGAAP